MSHLLFDVRSIEPGQVTWDTLPSRIDPGKPLLPQMPKYFETMVVVEFPNGCQLHVEWWPEPMEESEFLVVVSQNGPGEEWNPFVERHVATLEDLRAAVEELADVARKRPPLPASGTETGT